MRTLEIDLFIVVIFFLVGAFVAAYFRKWPHSSPLEQLTLIANDRWGWTAQAIMFPLAFLATAVLFLLLALQLPETWPRWLGLIAAALFAVGWFLWVPISISRLRYWPEAVELLHNYDPAHPVDVNFGDRTFWQHTISVLLAIVFMSVALALGQALPVLGWILVGLAAAGLFVRNGWQTRFVIIRANRLQEETCRQANS